MPKYSGSDMRIANLPELANPDGNRLLPHSRWLPGGAPSRFRSAPLALMYMIPQSRLTQGALK